MVEERQTVWYEGELHTFKTTDERNEFIKARREECIGEIMPMVQGHRSLADLPGEALFMAKCNKLWSPETQSSLFSDYVKALEKQKKKQQAAHEPKPGQKKQEKRKFWHLPK